MRDISGEPAREAIQMLGAFGQDERRAAFAHGLDDVVADELIARLVLDQLLVQSMELDSGVCTCGVVRLKRRRTYDHGVLKRSCGGLTLRADSKPYRSALHEDDRVVTVLPRDGRGQPRHE